MRLHLEHMYGALALGVRTMRQVTTTIAQSPSSELLCAAKSIPLVLFAPGACFAFVPGTFHNEPPRHLLFRSFGSLHLAAQISVLLLQACASRIQLWPLQSLHIFARLPRPKKGTRREPWLVQSAFCRQTQALELAVACQSAPQFCWPQRPEPRHCKAP